tara:strand:- start:3596 stop:7072 length:3477 start_codon:yes stop_codon:yes gene_type:complete
MAEGTEITYVSGLHANNDAKFFEDVYIYGNLYYDLDGTDNLTVDNLTVNHQANFKDIFATGIGTYNGPITFNSGTYFAGIATFTEPIEIDYLHVKERFWVGTDESGQTLTAYPELYGDRVGINSTIPQDSATLDVGGSIIVSGGIHQIGAAGSVGIGSTRPEREVDVAGDVKIDRLIYDRRNEAGANGYYLQRDEHGIVWVAPPPAQVEGIFLQNEGAYVGSGFSFTTLNLIGTGSGGDLVHAVQDASNQNLAHLHFTDNWVKNNSGLHTMGANVGINIATPTSRLHVDGTAKITDDVEFTSNTQSTNKTSGALVVGGGVGIALRLNVGEGADIAGVLNVDSTTQSTNTGTGAAIIDGGVGIGKNLNVGGNGTFTGRLDVNDTTQSGNSTNGAAVIDGGVGIGKNLNVGENAQITGNLLVESNTTLEKTVKIEGGTWIDSGLVISGFTTGTISTAIFSHNAGFATNSHRSGFTTYADLAGIATYSKVAGFATNAHRAGFATYADTAGIATYVLNAGVTTFVATKVTSTDREYFLTFVDDAVDTPTGTGQTVRVDTGIKYNPAHDSLNVVGILTVGGATTIHGSLELEGTLIDKNNSVAAGKTDYRLSSVGSGVSWRPPGVETTNAIYVTVDGNDANSGLLEGDAKRSIAGACEIAQAGDTIIVRSGVYYENNPVGLRTDVAISGEDLRLVTVVPLNNNKDVFHVRRGCLIQNLNFAGETSSTLVTGGAVAFPPLTNSEKAVSGYIALGPANEGPRRGNPALGGRYKSPYVRNCTNFMTGSIGMKIDGNHVSSNYTGTVNIGQDLKSMVCDSFTQYNEAGIGVSLTNKGYAQLVSIFTIGCEKAIYADSGGQCDLTNSNSSFGNFGLYADGVSSTEYTGKTLESKVAEGDEFVIENVKDSFNNFRKPFDGQAVFFKVDLDDFADTTSTGVMAQPFQVIREVKILDGGSGYVEGAPPNIIVDIPLGPEGIRAELSANVSAAGTVTSVDVIASGRNFLPQTGSGPTQRIGLTTSPTSGTSAIMEVITDPIYYTVNTATEPSAVVGITTLSLNEFVPFAVAKDTDVEFRRISRIITSSHSFEYVGAGTDINRANPFQGGEPIPENEIVAINGGQVPFTSTDQKGNFRIGEGLTIDQTTSTISGRDFNRAIQAQLTPLILALK